MNTADLLSTASRRVSFSDPNRRIPQEWQAGSDAFVAADVNARADRAMADQPAL